VTQMLRHLLSSVGNRVGVIGTLGTFIGDDQIPSARTTPESPDLFKLLAQMVAASVDTVCMEVSSHALELERVAGITFDIAIFTNLTQDHLDFHETMENYFLAKQKLFTNKRAKAAVICTDDQWGNRLLSITDAAQVVSVGPGSDWKVENVETNLSGITSFNLVGPDVNCIVEIPMYGIFNAMNAALCLAACAILGYDPSNLASRFNSLPQVAGRMQVVTNSQQITALVDYAHTPDAVEKVLANIRTASPKKLVAVLGCGGNRDALKRPIMGAVAAQIADVVVVTDDNPRYEAPDQIRAEILSGITDSTAEIIEIGDRRIAIRTALKLAEPGTVVAVLGKGHEIGQEVSGVVYEFDDAQVIREESANV
ncbi:MAG: UDP-N-acetylmuramoyl-L-alanyl-D-glutamate--2,6-diaminopimelate ligase, partial [Actinomycetales bacterium]|nr:UDP-N-acetylmuramoyl-L-alanyl-D-glutamate--2,6-diaminopimelate ligase [Actinomycetales bacterium]